MIALPNSVQTWITIFLAIFIEAAPFLLLGSLVSGLIEAFLDRERLTERLPGNPFAASLIGTLMGLAIPVCECGVIPVTRRLFRKGLPPSTGVAFVLAAPIINPIVLAATWAAFGSSVVFWARSGMALVISGSIGLLFALSPHPDQLLATGDLLPDAAKADSRPAAERHLKGLAWRHLSDGI